MNTDFSEQAIADISHWNKTDPKKVDKIVRLLDDIEAHPFEGIGKPEALKHDLQGYWSRRIDREHRLVYKVDGDTIFVASCRYHYK